VYSRFRGHPLYIFFYFKTLCMQHCRILFSALIALMISGTALAQGTKNFLDKNYIEVSGTAELEYTPDKIYIGVLLSEKDSKAKYSVARQEKELLQALKKLGIDTQKEVFIKDLSGNLKTGFLNRDLLLSKQYQILVHDGKTAGQVFLALDDIGITNAQIEKLESSEIEQYRQQVKVEAVKAARKKAGLLCEAAGQQAGKALFIQEQQFNARPVYANAAMFKEKAADSAADLDFETLKVEASVLCRFEIL